jgi:hypothetical protein
MNTTLSSKTPDRVHATKGTLWEKIRSNADLACVSLIVAIFLVRFSGTIFLRKSISKHYLTALWDSLFYPLRAGQSFNMDPSLVQQHIPERFLVANLWQHGVPLWNPFTGFGVPLLADPNAFVLSPVFALFTLFPTMYTWNMIVIFQLLMGALFTYFLCREFALNRLGSVVAALLFAFCPSIQSQCEQVFGSCLIPFVFFFFVRVAKNGSMRNVILAGIAAAIDLLSANPESAFMTISMATGLTCLTAYYSDRSGFKLLPLLGRFVFAGLIAFGLTAPVLIPFAEYLLRCDSYKFADKQLVFPFQGIVTNFLFPFYQRNNLFWGPLSWWGMLAALLLPSKHATNRVPLFICLAFSIFAIAQIFPVNLLFGFPPFSMVLLHYYVLPHYVFFVSVLSGLGIGRLFDSIVSDYSIKRHALVCIALIPVVLSLALSPFICSSWHNLDLTLPYPLTIEDSQFDWIRWGVNGLCAIAMLAVLLATLGKAPKLKKVGLTVFVIVGLFDLLAISYSALPIRPAFRYPRDLPIEASRLDGRFLSIGNHLLKPNINVVYQLPTVLEWNALHPKGFTEFMTACGAQVDKFGQCYPPTINRILDVTGTRTIISQQPVLDEQAIRTAEGHKIWRDAINYNDLLTVTDLELFQDPKAKTLFCRLTADPRTPGYSDFRLYLDIKDKQGTSALYTEPQDISSITAKQSILCSSMLPTSTSYWRISLRLVSDKDSRVLKPKKVPFGTIGSDGSWLLATSDDVSRFTTIRNDRFKLVSNREGILTYENETAFDRYFLVRQIEWIDHQDKFVDYLKTHATSLRETAVLDRDLKEQIEKLFATARQNSAQPSIPNVPDSITKLNTPTSRAFDFTGSSITRLHTSASTNALLVTSDLYYPGWKASIDGAESPIFCADRLFRAVVVPPGQHIVEFKYEPLSIKLGFLLFSITVTVVFVSAVVVPLRNRSTS